MNGPPAVAADRRLRATLGDPALAWLLQRARQRLERGQALTGRVTLRAPTWAQRAALEAFLGRPPGRGETLGADLAEVDALVRHARLAPGLRAAVETLTGPVTDRRAERVAHEASWAAAREAAAARLAGRAWAAQWLDDLDASGLLRRLAGDEPARAAALLDAAAAVAERLPADPPVSVPELASAVVGDSHGLDPGRPVATLALRAAARIAGLDADGDEAGRREVWEAVGVVPDELSAPVLVLGLRADAASLTGRTLSLHADAGEPARLSLRQLRRHPPRFGPAVTGLGVFVCENPAVVAAAADRLGARSAPLVCLDGQRKSAARVLLDRLAASGITPRYHGDFDWGGLRIGNVVMRDHGARAWRYGAADYAAACAGLTHARPLDGTPVDAVWDAELAPALRRRGWAVHEEAVLDSLLGDLAV